MPIVYRLSTELKREPELVQLAQALTLDAARPLLGLKGDHGLYGSDEWWENIRAGLIRSETRNGVIQRLYRAGMDSGPKPNSFEMICDDGTVWNESIRANVGDRNLYQVGNIVRAVYIHDRRKAPDRAGGQFVRILIEIRIVHSN